MQCEARERDAVEKRVAYRAEGGEKQKEQRAQGRARGKEKETGAREMQTGNIGQMRRAFTRKKKKKRINQMRFRMEEQTERTQGQENQHWKIAPYLVCMRVVA